MLMRTIMRDPEHQRIMERDGYIIIEDLLSPDEIASLLEKYHSLPSDLNQGFHATIHSSKVEYRRKVSEEINKVFTDKVNQYLLDYTPIFANYTVKEPDPNSNFEMHLDWTMVDEKRFSSITTWCPLIDITEENGHLWVLKGSHKFDYTIRGGPGLFIQTDKKYGPEVPQKFERVKMKLQAGSCYIYDHRIFHGSPPNRSSEVRIAINHTMVPKETNSWHYHFLGDTHDKVEIFEVDPDFYNRHILFSRPEGVKSLGIYDVIPNFLSQEQVDSLYEVE